MCGFTGSVSLENIDISLIEEANKFIECRGPDSKCFIEKKFNTYNLNFWFNRLSILDLTEEANQPMYSNHQYFVSLKYIEKSQLLYGLKLHVLR